MIIKYFKGIEKHFSNDLVKKDGDIGDNGDNTTECMEKSSVKVSPKIGGQNSHFGDTNSAEKSKRSFQGFDKVIRGFEDKNKKRDGIINFGDGSNDAIKGACSESAPNVPNVSKKNNSIYQNKVFHIGAKENSAEHDIQSNLKSLLGNLIYPPSKEEINYYYELFEERASIIEYDSECTKEEAESLAFEGVKQLCEERNQIIESVIKHMKTLVDALIPFASINEGHIKGINSVSELRGLKIPNIEISFLADDSVEIKNLTNKSGKHVGKFVSKHLKLKNFILDRKKKKEFIDEYDLRLYYDEVTNRTTFNAEVYKGGGRLGIVDILFVAVAFNKRSLTHQVSSSGIVLVSMPTDDYNEEIKRWDYVQITGRIKSTDCYKIGEIVYIKADKIKLLKKGLV